MQLDTKTVLITGCGSGIGRATALRCAEAGATVVSTDVDSDGAEDTAASIREDGGEATSYDLDVTDADRFHEVVDDVVAEDGLDVLVNNVRRSLRDFRSPSEIFDF